MPISKKLIIPIVRKFIIWGIILYQTLQWGLFFVFNFKTKFWRVKERSNPPKCLSDEKNGRHFFIQANGLKFHCVEKGNPQNPLMLFVHGFPECWYSWRYQMRDFSKDYWCVAYDQRGYGESDKPDGYLNYRIDNTAEDIYHISNVLLKDSGKRFILVAHDWGSVIAFQFLEKYMDRVDRYICMDGPPSPVYQKAAFTSWDQFKRSWYIFFFQAPFLPEFSFRCFDLKGIEMLGDGKITDTITHEDIEAFKYYFAQPGALTPPIHYYRNLETPRQIHPRPNSFRPGLYLMGENDQYISMATGPATAEYMQKCEFKIVPDAHHFLQQDKPQKVNEFIREFLNKKYD